jgi:hypothetical protein
MNRDLRTQWKASLKKSRASAFSIAALVIAAVFYLGSLTEKTPVSPPPAQGKATIYPAPAGIVLSKAYKVSIAGKAVPVYVAKVGNYDAATRKINPDTASFASFDMDGPVTVTVAVGYKVNSVKILPASTGIVSKINGKTVSFTVPKPKNLTIEINGEWLKSLHVFANPPEKDIPNPKDTSVIYFGPGIHEVTHMVVGSNKTIYIAGGAYIRTQPDPAGSLNGRSESPTFTLRGSNITVRGRGIVDATLTTAKTRNIFLSRGSDIKFEGVTMLDPNTWFMPVRQSDHVYISNVKLIGYRGNSDAIDIANSRDVLIEDCFLRTSDDLVVIKSDRNQGKVHHVVTRRCVLWNQLAHALSLGAELREDVDDILFTDCDVIHDKGREWVLRVFHSDSSRISNVRFENIRIADSRRLISLWIDRSVWSLDKNQRGHIQGISFKNIQAEGDPLTVELKGYDAKHGIEDIIFENVTINGTKLTRDKVLANEFVKNVTVKP